jgi:predicted XRE-type DNA-binding protein
MMAGNKTFYEKFRDDRKLQYEVVNALNNKQISKNQIARVLNITEYRVNQILDHIKKYEEEANKKLP